MHTYRPEALDKDPQETREWVESLESIIVHDGGRDRARYLIKRVLETARRHRVVPLEPLTTDFVNTIPREEEPPNPGDEKMEKRIRRIVRWNAVAMVHRANTRFAGLGGHLSTYASSASLYEVGFNHFFRGRELDGQGDLIFYQGHAAPGMYARAFLEGRLSVEQMEHFRREAERGRGLSSYPHPRLMPHLWEFPTVSMGLGPLTAIYQARFNRYLQARGIKDTSRSRVWCFVGDGETDEPESLGSLSIAAREGLDNLIFVVNCNLQRLDGPVRGNGHIVQELEASFRGAGWNVIKVLWGCEWDPILANDRDGLLAKRMGEVVDGQYQKYAVESGAYFREHFFGTDPRLLDMVKHLSDDQLKKLRLGGHDPVKVYNAFKFAVEHKGQPTVVLVRTIKGYGLGEAGEGKNITHQQKKLNEADLKTFRTRFGIPISDAEIADAPFYRPPDDSTELQYLRERRKALGGFMPARTVQVPALDAPIDPLFEEFAQGTEGRKASTTMVFVRILAKLLRDKEIGDLIVPIVPDEARTFGMEALFRQVGIYSHIGQKYEPVDMDTLLYYKEATDGQILEEGITEAGSMSSFIAAGTAYATHGLNTIPFFIYYSMFGFQRVADLIWAGADSRTRGFLLGATAGRTTLAGEGLQHQDGHSHVFSLSVPNCVSYDPAYAYELAVIIQDGIRRMYKNQENVFYYLTVMNDQYEMPPMPEGARDGILKGMYRCKSAANAKAKHKAQLLGSGAILNEVIAAQKLLEKYDVAADVWSVTSYQELYRDANAVERWNTLHPMETPRVAYVAQQLKDTQGVIVAASDYLKVLPGSLDRWMPRRVRSLGTDGFGRSDDRAGLRDFFEVDAKFVAIATLSELAQEGKIDRAVVAQAIKDLGINADKANPANS